MYTIALGSDHAGFHLKEAIKKHLLAKGIKINDFGTNTDNIVDYPDYIFPAATSVSNGNSDVGIVFGGSGNGEAIAANKVRGIRCGLCWNVESASLTKAHNDANMIALGGRMISEELGIKIVDKWLDLKFDGGRHQQRIDKIAAFEQDDAHQKSTMFLSDFIYPFVRFVVSFVFIAQIIHQVFFLNESGLPNGYLGFILINISLILFHIMEGIQELKGKFINAGYFRISSVFIEAIIIGKLTYSSYQIIQQNENDNFIWLNIIQQIVFVALIFLLLIKDFSRINREHKPDVFTF